MCLKLFQMEMFLRYLGRGKLVNLVSQRWLANVEETFRFVHADAIIYFNY